MNAWLKISLKSGFAIGIAATTLGAAHAQDVNFSAVNLATVSSALGQNFAAVGGTTVNVRLISGTLRTLVVGQSPDPTGFYALQDTSALNPFTFQFTLSTPQVFEIDQNETVTSFETNSFSMPTGTWNVLSASNVTQTGSGSQIGFTGTLISPPYGTYDIAGSGSSFNFTVNNQAGLGSSGDYGSAISLHLTAPSSAAAAPEPGSIAFVLVAGAAAGASGLRLLSRRVARTL